MIEWSPHGKVREYTESTNRNCSDDDAHLSVSTRVFTARVQDNRLHTVMVVESSAFLS